jgi:uncharacterized protein (TIGR02246 family)
MSFRILRLFGVATLSLCLAWSVHRVEGQDEQAVAEVRIESKKLTDAFNAGKASDVAAMFLSKGELIDEQGNVYQGQAAIKELLTKFFEKFPETQVSSEIESVRIVGPVAVEEGIRTTTSKGGDVAQVRYITVFAKSEQSWRIVSVRDYAEEVVPTAGDLLAPLEWLVGDWINEGADARVKITYKWSEDRNFILGDFLVTKEDQTVMKSTQRIGWDPILGKPRSWMFDSDGGFAESTWTQTDDAWIVRSNAVMPDGLTGAAIVTIKIGDNGRYVMSGTNRVVGNSVQDDYEITIVKQPPTPASASAK